MRPSLKERQQAARLAFENAGREITQNFDTMNVNVALAAGTLAAVLAVLGAGELFSDGLPGDEMPTLSPVSLVVLALAAPLILRFQIRSTIAYQQLIRFRGVQDAAWSYLTRRSGWRAFDLHVELYVSKWLSPNSLASLSFHNAKYGFVWVDLVVLGSLIWGFISTVGLSPRLIAGGILVVAAGWETWTLLVHDREKYFSVPDSRTLGELEVARAEPPDEAEDVSATTSAPGAVGLFIGWLGARLLRPS